MLNDRSAEPASDAELIEALDGRIDGDEIRTLRRRPYRYATSAPLEVVRVVTDGGETELILKDLGRELLLPDARASKPEFLHEPRRELEAYRRILGPAGLGPRCFAVIADSARPRHCLLLAKVPGVELWQVGELEVWEGVSRWLGRFHATFDGREGELRAANPHLLDHSEAWFADWAERARSALLEAEDPRTAELEAALGGYADHAAALAALPRTLVHGELYPSNVLVVREERDGVYPVDWEMAAIGPGPVDLAALTGGWGTAERHRLDSAYLEGLAAAGGEAPGADELQQSVARCRLHLALQWLGWSPGWRPPPEHAHDWLGEALSLARELAS